MMIKKGTSLDLNDIYKSYLLLSNNTTKLEKSIQNFFQFTFNSFLYNQFTQNVTKNKSSNKDSLCLICDKFIFTEEFIAKNNLYHSNSSYQTFYCINCLNNKKSLKNYFLRGLWGLYSPPISHHSTPLSSTFSQYYKGYNSSITYFLNSLDSDTSNLFNFSIQFLSIILTNFYYQVVEIQEEKEIDDNEFQIIWKKIWEEIKLNFNINNYISSSNLFNNNNEIISESYILIKPWIIYENNFPIHNFLSFSSELLGKDNILNITTNTENIFSKIQDFLIKTFSISDWNHILLLCDSFSYNFSLLNSPYLTLGQSLPLIINPEDRHNLSHDLYSTYLNDILIYLEGKELNGGYLASESKDSLPSPWCYYELDLDYDKKEIKSTEKNNKILNQYGDLNITYSLVYDIKERVCARISQAASSLNSLIAGAVPNPFLPFVYQSSFLHPFFSQYQLEPGKEGNRGVFQSCQANLLMDISQSSNGFTLKFIANSDIYSEESFTFNFNHNSNPSIDNILLKENNNFGNEKFSEELKYFPLNKNKALFDIRHSLFLKCSCTLCHPSIELYSLSCYAHMNHLKSFGKKMMKKKKSKILPSYSKYFIKQVSLIFYENIEKFNKKIEEYKEYYTFFSDKNEEILNKLLIIDEILKDKVLELKKIISYSNNLLNNSNFSVAILYYSSFFNEIFHLILNPQQVLYEIDGDKRKKMKLNEEIVQEEEKINSLLIFYYFKKYHGSYLGSLFNSFSAILFDLMISTHSNPKEFLSSLSLSLIEYSKFFKTSKNSNELYYEIRRLFNLELIVLVAKFSLFYEDNNPEVSAFLLKFHQYELEKTSISTIDTPFEKILDVQTKPHENSSAYLTFSALFSLEECALIVDTAKKYAEKHSGWTTSRHYSVPTTDIPVHSLTDYLVPHSPTNEMISFSHWFSIMLNERIRPLLLSQFVEDKSLMENCQVFINDIFIVKYEGQKEGEENQDINKKEYLKKFNYQKYLPLHTDQSTHSFTIALNSKNEYEGGGTYFSPLPLHQNVRAEIGNLVSFNGNILHGGEPVHYGTRFIIAGFTILLPNMIKKEEWIEACEAEEEKEEFEQPQDGDEIEVSLGSIFFERQKKVDENNMIIDNNDSTSSSSSSFSFSFF